MARLDMDDRDWDVLASVARGRGFDPQHFIAGILSAVAVKYRDADDRKRAQLDILHLMRAHLSGLPTLVAVLSHSMAAMDISANRIAEAMLEEGT